MIKCDYCQRSHVANTVFCDECGNYLLGDFIPETGPLNGGDGHWRDRPTGDIDLASLFRQNDRSQALRLQIGSRKREVEIPLNRDIHVGRIDPASTILPDIDLTGDGTLARSVSRRHARISKRGNTIVVEDLGSSNGTFINGEKLTPYLPRALQDGDTLQLGKLLIGVRIQS